MERYFTACQTAFGQIIFCQTHLRIFVNSIFGGQSTVLHSKHTLSTSERLFSSPPLGGAVIPLCRRKPFHRFDPCPDPPLWRGGHRFFISSAVAPHMSTGGAVMESAGEASRPSCRRTLAASTELPLCPRLPASLRDPLAKPKKNCFPVA